MKILIENFVKFIIIKQIWYCTNVYIYFYRIWADFSFWFF